MWSPTPTTMTSSTENPNLLTATAAEKNKELIFDVLKGYLPKTSGQTKAFEIASGTGQHVTYFAAKLPHVIWQPSDIDEKYLKSIPAHTEEQNLKNVLEPVYLDMMNLPTDNPSLLPESFDLMLNINMVHISPWEASVGLFLTAGKFLKPSGILFMYGPFSIDGNLTPESNVKFDAWLKAKDPSYGVRDTKDLKKLAADNGLSFENMVDMPSNNKCLIFRKNVLS